MWTYLTQNFYWEKNFTAVSSTGLVDSTYVSIKLKDEFLHRFIDIPDNAYTDDDLFFDFFKGLYITTDFGSASMLYVSQIDLNYHHSYTYTTQNVAGQDSTVTVNLVTSFPANSWVRQVNRFLHPNKANVLNTLNNQVDQIHYISSPANIYTRIKLPIKEMQNKLEKDDSRLVINNAKLKVNVIDTETKKFKQPIPANILLVKESSLDRFFINKEMPSDTCAILGTYARAKNKDTGEYEYFYSFDLARFISHELKQAKAENLILPDMVDFVLVPVKLKINENNNITEISQQFIMNAVSICGGNHSQRPIKTGIIYSSF